MTRPRPRPPETLVALSYQHDAHGRLLPAVPRGDYSGGPTRYSRDLRIIRSLGLENFQLTTADQAVHERELILSLRFDDLPDLRTHNPSRPDPGENPVSYP